VKPVLAQSSQVAGSLESTPSLEAQRADLCARLQAQRRVIAQQLGVATDGADTYPRSKTMRLLTQRPRMIFRILGGLATLLQLR
jgi:hypothetical protein